MNRENSLNVLAQRILLFRTYTSDGYTRILLLLLRHINIVLSPAGISAAAVPAAAISAAAIPTVILDLIPSVHCCIATILLDVFSLHQVVSIAWQA